MVFALALAAWTPATAASQARQACILAAAAEQTEAKRGFQQGLRDLIVEADANYEGLADLNRDLQIALSERRLERLGRLLEREPGRLVADRGASVFWNFDWSEADEAAFVAEDPDFAARARETEALRALNDSHPDWPGLRLLVQQIVAPKDSFTALTDRLRESQTRLEKALAACPG